MVYVLMSDSDEEQRRPEPLEWSEDKRPSFQHQQHYPYQKTVMALDGTGGDEDDDDMPLFADDDDGGNLDHQPALEQDDSADDDNDEEWDETEQDDEEEIENLDTAENDNDGDEEDDAVSSAASPLRHQQQEQQEQEQQQSELPFFLSHASFLTCDDQDDDVPFVVNNQKKTKIMMHSLPNFRRLPLPPRQSRTLRWLMRRHGVAAMNKTTGGWHELVLDGAFSESTAPWISRPAFFGTFEQRPNAVADFARPDNWTFLSSSSTREDNGNGESPSPRHFLEFEQRRHDGDSDNSGSDWDDLESVRNFVAKNLREDEDADSCDAGSSDDSNAGSSEVASDLDDFVAADDDFGDNNGRPVNEKIRFHHRESEFIASIKGFVLRATIKGPFGGLAHLHEHMMPRGLEAAVFGSSIKNRAAWDRNWKNSSFGFESVLDGVSSAEDNSMRDAAEEEEDDDDENIPFAVKLANAQKQSPSVQKKQHVSAAERRNKENTKSINTSNDKSSRKNETAAAPPPPTARKLLAGYDDETDHVSAMLSNQQKSMKPPPPPHKQPPQHPQLPPPPAAPKQPPVAARAPITAAVVPAAAASASAAGAFSVPASSSKREEVQVLDDDESAVNDSATTDSTLGLPVGLLPVHKEVLSQAIDLAGDVELSALVDFVMGDFFTMANESPDLKQKWRVEFNRYIIFNFRKENGKWAKKPAVAAAPTAVAAPPPPPQQQQPLPMQHQQQHQQQRDVSSFNPENYAFKRIGCGGGAAAPSSSSHTAASSTTQGVSLTQIAHGRHLENERQKQHQHQQQHHHQQQIQMPSSFSLTSCSPAPRDSSQNKLGLSLRTGLGHFPEMHVTPEQLEVMNRFILSDRATEFANQGLPDSLVIANVATELVNNVFRVVTGDARKWHHFMITLISESYLIAWSQNARKKKFVAKS